MASVVEPSPGRRRFPEWHHRLPRLLLKCVRVLSAQTLQCRQPLDTKGGAAFETALGVPAHGTDGGTAFETAIGSMKTVVGIGYGYFYASGSPSLHSPCTHV